MAEKVLNPNPKIIAFACEKWGYSVADLTGTGRKKYSSDVFLVRVKCTGRISLDLIVESFVKGADGVAIIGWKEDECDFGTGNVNTFKHIQFLKQLLKHIGVSEDRVEQYWVSAAEVERFLESVNDITHKVSVLPPIPKKSE